uniref:Si:dkey-9i23.15 n=1 Tax=Cyprinus carpio TaxID=7962 RepID=A0A8C2ACR6_CYPCA
MVRCLYFATLILSVSYQLIPLCHSFEWDEQSSPLHNVRSIFTSLSKEAHSCLVSTIGEKRVDLSLQFLQRGVKWLSDAIASAHDMVIRYITEILESAGIDGKCTKILFESFNLFKPKHIFTCMFSCFYLAKLPFQKVTPEGVVFVTQWALLVVVAYWIIAFILRLVVGAVRQALWLLKVTFAMGVFGLILSDTGASAETTAIRLAGLACVCVLIGIGTSAKQDTHLEDKIKILERRLREKEKSKME